MSAGFNISYSSTDAKRLLLCLLAFEVLLAAIYCAIRVIAPDLRWGPLVTIFDVDQEMSIPTWFSSVQIFIVALLVIILARTDRRIGLGFFILGLGLIFLSMDESSAIHEKIIEIAKNLNIGWLLFLTLDGNHKAWAIPYALIGIPVLLVTSRALLHVMSNFQEEASIVLIGGIMVVVGAVGLEIVSLPTSAANPTIGLSQAKNFWRWRA